MPAVKSKPLDSMYLLAILDAMADLVLGEEPYAVATDCLSICHTWEERENLRLEQFSCRVNSTNYKMSCKICIKSCARLNWNCALHKIKPKEVVHRAQKI